MYKLDGFGFLAISNFQNLSVLVLCLSPLYCACVQVGWCQAGGVVIFTAEVTLVQGIYWVLGYWAPSHPTTEPQHYDVAKK